MTEQVQQQQQQPTALAASAAYAPRKKQPRRAALVVNETVAHRPAEGQPTSTVLRYSRHLETNEQPFVRHFDAPAEWAPLQTGWLSAAGMLLLSSAGGTVELGLMVEPPAAEPPGSRTMWSPPKGAAFVVFFARVRHGESLRFEPIDLAPLCIRRTGEKPAKCVLTLIPE